jgi:hypothetical protein
MNSLKAYGSDSSSSDSDDSDVENGNVEEKRFRESEKTFHLKASTSMALVVRTRIK